jgi:hypothetical protein
MKNPFIRELSTGIEIDATAGDVWNVLVDFERYPEWTRIFEFALGHTDVGERLTVMISSGGSKRMTFEPLLLEAREPVEFRWKGRLLLRGIFDGEHIFRITEACEGSVRFTHSEKFSGFLVPWLWRDLDTNTRRGFERFNMDIKKRSEHISRSERRN